MEYYLMRKNDVVTLCELDDSGNILDYSENFRNPELAPLGYRSYKDHLARWWKNRHIPLRQGRVESMLRQRGFDEPSEYLLRNLGLSLTDYYWIRPVDSGLRWEDVNLFDNDFKENLLMDSVPRNNTSASSCTPNSTLRGELEKSWVIRSGKRVLVKGNHGRSSAESINEIIATEFHVAQGYDNSTAYKLIKIKNKPYDYGCYSEAFTSSSCELISAYELLTSEAEAHSLSSFERLITIAAKHGIDKDQLRADLEYQIMSDYVLSNVDRHMDNIGFLRDADSLRLIRMAPIFDTGKAFGGNAVTPYTDEEIDSIEVNSFRSIEKDLLDLVSDPAVLDTSRLLDPGRIRKLYEKDSKMRPGQIDIIVRLYNIKTDRVCNLCSK